MFLNFFTFKFNFSLNSGEDDNAGPAHSALPAGPAAPRSVRHFKKDAPHAPALSCESPSRAEMTIPVLRSSEFKGIKPPFEKKKKKKGTGFHCLLSLLHPRYISGVFISTAVGLPLPNRAAPACGCTQQRLALLPLFSWRSLIAPNVVVALEKKNLQTVKVLATKQTRDSRNPRQVLFLAHLFFAVLKIFKFQISALRNFPTFQIH